MAGTPQVDARTFQDFVERNQVAVVDFYADWCGPCKIVSPIIEKLAMESDGRAGFAKLDVDANLAIAERFGVMSIPTVFIFKNGKPADSIVGAVSAEVYRSRIARFL